MKQSNAVNYFYKACDLDAIDDVNRKRYEYLNEYGFNFDCNKNKVINEIHDNTRTKRYANGTKR